MLGNTANVALNGRGIADYESLFIYGEEGPDFVDDGDSYVAEVSIPQAHFKEGMQYGGWMDMPSTTFGPPSILMSAKNTLHNIYTVMAQMRWISWLSRVHR